SRSSSGSPTSRGSSSRSLWATSWARGTRCRSRTTAWCRRGRTSCDRSRRGRPARSGRRRGNGRAAVEFLLALGRDGDHHCPEQRDPEAALGDDLVPRRLGKTLVEQERPDDDADERVADRDRRHGCRELPGRERDLLDDEREDAGERERVRLPTREHGTDAVVAEDLDRGLAEGGGKAVKNSGARPVEARLADERALVAHDDERCGDGAEDHDGDGPLTCRGVVVA